jgi:hypothetical protein
MTTASPQAEPTSGNARSDPYPKNLLSYSFLNKNKGLSPKIL